jgi:hypothetical protein
MSYSEELTKEIVAEYVADPTRDTVDAIAERIGKSARSVIAKLAAAGVYQTPKRTTKTGEPIVKKEELVEQIGKWLGIEVPTLAKTGKLDLKKLHREIAVVTGNENELPEGTD